MCDAMDAGWSGLDGPRIRDAHLSHIGQAPREAPPPNANVIAAALGADLSGPANDPLRRGELLQPHGPASVQPARADADLGPAAKLSPVDEPGGRVDQHGGAVHLPHEPVRAPLIQGDDPVGLAGAVRADMLQRRI